MTADRQEAEQRLERQDKAIRTLAWWLVEAQTGFVERDAQGIEKILDGESDERA